MTHKNDNDIFDDNYNSPWTYSMVTINMLRIVVHIIYFHVLLFLAHCPHPSTPFPKSCHGNYTCIFLNCTDIYGDTSLFAVILMAYTLCVLLHNTCVAMKLYLCLPYYDYG